MVYGGTRWVEQYLAIPLVFQAAPTSSGGVVQLDRSYSGGALRFSTGETVRLAIGVEYDRMDERRRGFINNNGVAGALKRDEDDEVSSTDLYAQVQWNFAERWSAHGGLRTSRVEFRSTDYFIAPSNPNDSGTRDYSATTPVAGLLFKASRHVSVYANLGRGFETPTFAELAHQTGGATGLNFALAASRSRHGELGAKALVPGVARLNAAVFGVQTKDEIVVEQASGGRTTFKNAGRTERKGLELAADSATPGPFYAQLAYTWLDATFEDAFVSSGTTVPAGNLLPGVPKSQAYARLGYRQPRLYAYAEGLWRSRVAVNDANSEFADAYNVFNLVGGLVQQGKAWRITEYVRMDNATDRNYVGSVIVNETNGRFYEPSPRRSMTVGIQASVQF
jgi:iron complex outermembrane receptor protein